MIKKAIRCCLKAVFYDRVCVYVCVRACAWAHVSDREDGNAEGLLEPLGIFPTGDSGFHHLSHRFLSCVLLLKPVSGIKQSCG